MSIAIAQTKHIFGIKTNVTSNISYHDEHTIVYPAGNICVIYNVDQKQQKFINGSDKNLGFTAMAVSPNRRYVALAEMTAERPTITVYDLTTQKKRKVLQCPEIQAETYVSLQFSPDSKYLVSQSGAPDYQLIFWTWEKARIMAMVRSTTPQGTVEMNQTQRPRQVAFNPHDNTQVSVVGDGVFRIYRYTEGALKQVVFLRTEQVNLVSHCWLSEERVAAGTSDGYVHIYEAGELKATFDVMDDKQRNQGTDRPTSSPPETADGVRDSESAVYQMAVSSKGLLCSCGPRRVVIMEKTEEGKETFKKAKEFLPKKPQELDVVQMESEVILSMAVSPAEENLVITTNRNQIYQVAMTATDLGRGSDVGYFEAVTSNFHCGNVTGLDVCIRKPLVATCSMDKSVRVWNYETCHLEIYKEFAEEAYSIALHPSGLYILVGFSDKLRLMNILIDDIRSFKELPLRACKECAFSHGGHLFAAVQNNVIQVYSSTTYENVFSLQGHNGRVRSLVWSQDDTRLVSCGVDGAVYEWDIVNRKRASEVVLKSCQYTGVTVSPDAKIVYAVGNDKTVKEISESHILRSVETEEMILSHISLSHSGRMLFAGCTTGALRSLKFPLTVPGEWTEHPAHNARINNMKVTHDDQCLVTISEDATVIIWKVQDKEGRGMKREKETGWAEEILITKTDLEDKNQIMTELKTRVDELRMENEYQLRLKDMNYNEKIKELNEKFIQEMEALKIKNQALKTDKDKASAKHEEEFSDLMENQQKVLQDLDAANNQKLMLEYEKYQELQAKSQKQQEDYEGQLVRLEEAREQALEELTEQYETRIRQLQLQLDQSQDKTRQQQREYEEVRCQIEEDADREILDLKTKYEHKLREERDANTRLRGETGIMKKKFASLNKEIDDHKEEIKRYQNEEAKLNNIIKSLQKDIEGLRKEIQERDETIQDKEKRIYDLKKKNQELEKFKFVLDYKIKELKKQIEPREEEVRRMKEQIQEMESELERFHKNNEQLELNIKEQKKKLDAYKREMKIERQRTHDLVNQIKRFKTDLHNCVGYIQDPKQLKDNVKTLYEKHVQKDDISAEATVDADIQREYARQREHLEKTVASLRKKLSKDSDLHKADNVRIMQENVTLIKEINDLRKELKLARTQVHDLEAALGLHRKNNAEANALVDAMQTQNKNAVMEKDLEEKNKVIEIQQAELRRLRVANASLDSRPNSSEGRKLPPMES